jgi:hypothetical protein
MNPALDGAGVYPQATLMAIWSRRLADIHRTATIQSFSPGLAFCHENSALIDSRMALWHFFKPQAHRRRTLRLWLLQARKVDPLRTILYIITNFYRVRRDSNSRQLICILNG